MGIRIAIDIGGTFTDFISLDERSGSIIEEKAHTTPANYAKGVLNSIKKAGVSLAEATYFVHGTTVVINAVTERKGAKTALVTTKGFRDVLEIGRARRPDMYNYYFTKPKPFVKREYRYEVRERIDNKGNVVEPIKIEDLKAIAADCRKKGIEAVAVCLLHSYADSSHEEECKRVLERELPGVSITTSAEVIKEWREYERTSTVVLNAYVQPKTKKYLDSLEEQLKGFGLKIKPHAMQSNGGSATFAMAKQTPINLIESGPVGGVMGGKVLGDIIGEKNIITFDIGGTTAKTSLINRGEVKVTKEYRVEETPRLPGYPVKTPVVDIIEIGNGGGSIAWVDDVGTLQVGPKSAGAEPGPACYSQGGEDPTLTDANLVAGRINPDNFLGGEFNVSLEKARDSLKRIAEKFNMTTEEAALGVIKRANSNMMNALKLISVRRGYDPREFVMIAQGGNGPVMGPELGKELRVKKVIIPRRPATFSAFGMLMTDLRLDLVQTNIIKIDECDLNNINSIYKEMEETAVQAYMEQGLRAEDVIIMRTADLRYVGQEHTVMVPVPGKDVEAGALTAIKQEFDKQHEKHYSFNLPETLAEFVNLNVTAFCSVPKPQLNVIDSRYALEDAFQGKRKILFIEFGQQDCSVYNRQYLSPGVEITGPAVIEESKSVTLIDPEQVLNVDKYGNLIIFTRGER